MKQNVAVLDFDGLLTYPGFGDRILKPLINQERQFWFWTHNLRDSVTHALEKMGFARLAQDARIIDREIFSLWITRIEGIAGMLRSENDQEKELGGEVLRDLLRYSGIRSDEDGAKRFIEKYREYRAVTSNTYKYPPLLGEDNYLLIESDGTRYDPMSRVFRRINPQGQMDLARRGIYSLILVPEHPDVWAPELVSSTAFKRFAPDISFSPEDVVDELVPTIINWGGEHVVRDLSVERGLFETEGTIIQEGTSRHPERQ